jgi:hypothetical protein
LAVLLCAPPELRKAYDPRAERLKFADKLFEPIDSLFGGQLEALD